MKKSITVLTNDPVKPSQRLTMTGKVERFASVTPPRVVLRGDAGEKIRAMATIVPEKRFPFKVVDVKVRNGGNIRYDLIAPQDDAEGYRLEVENLKTTPGRYYSSIELITDSRIRPKITIAVYGHILNNAEKRN